MIPQLMNTGGGITVGDFAWSIQNDQGAIVGSGIFTLTNDSQFDTASVCLPPGAYGMIVTPLGDPTGGQPVFSIYHPSSQAGPSQAVTWIPPVPMPFTWFGPCSDGAQAVDEPSAIAVRTALSGGELHVWRADGAALGELRLLDARGGLVATDPGRSSDARLPLNERGRGLYLLQSAAGTVRFVVVD
jgi:hypothetical protein